MENIFSVRDKVILITGGSSGLGAHFAELFVHHGATVILFARRLDRLAQLQQRFNQHNQKVYICEGDVTNQTTYDSLFDLLKKEKLTIDVLINNAGIDIHKSFLNHDKHDWDSVFDVNLKGVAMISQCVAAHMIQHQKKGTFILISSAADTIVYQGGSPGYMASKAGVTHLTHSLANELSSYGIRVNAIAPAGFITEMTKEAFEGETNDLIKQAIPLKRFALLNEINCAMLLLASDASSYMTGTIIRVDGGMSLNRL